MSIPDLVTPADMLGKSIYADRARKADQINARHRERMTQIIQERDDLKFVLDRQNPWNEKAQELLDASRWAGHTLIEGCVTELKETRAELGQEVERVAVIEERFVDLDKERDRLEHQLETTRTENELLRAALAEARQAFAIATDQLVQVQGELRQAREENARLREALEKSKEFVQSWGELIDTQYPLWNDCMTTIQQALTP